jgi:hypothetical protein
MSSVEELIAKRWFSGKADCKDFSDPPGEVAVAEPFSTGCLSNKQ